MEENEDESETHEEEEYDFDGGVAPEDPGIQGNLSRSLSLFNC